MQMEFWLDEMPFSLSALPKWSLFLLKIRLQDFQIEPILHEERIWLPTLTRLNNLNSTYSLFLSCNLSTIALYTLSTDSSTVSLQVTSTSGFCGGSYGASTPVMFFISPALAFLYRPLTSRCSQISNFAFTKTSTKLLELTTFLTISLSFL